MATLNKKQIAEIVSRYDGGRGEGTTELGHAYDVAASTIRYHLKQADVYNPQASDEPVRVSDEDLGIDQESPTDLTALLANPALAKLIDAAVNARMAAMGAPSAPAGDPNAFAAFTATLTHLIEVQSMQQAGYLKPLPAEEIDRRAAAYIEMKAILKDCEQRGEAPEYLVGEGGFFECANALEFQPGSKIRTYLYPVEDFVPNNDAALAVHAAMITWIGGHTPGIGEQVEAAMKAANQTAPLVTGTLSLMSNRPQTVELVDTPRQTAPRKRMTGTITPERHDVSLAERAAGPQGPVFVGDRAA